MSKRTTGSGSSDVNPKKVKVDKEPETHVDKEELEEKIIQEILGADLEDDPPEDESEGEELFGDDMEKFPQAHF